MKNFFNRWWFGFALGIGLIIFEISTLVVSLLSAPAGSRWLGATIFNTGDMAVYLNYLAQAKHSWLIANLFNNLPQIPRFDFFWSLGGVLVKIGLQPLWAHEILRWTTTLILGFAIYATAKAITTKEKHARLASFLIIGGLSTGWIYDVWMGIANKWTPRSPATADLASEFAVAPTLLGGAHMIFSLALELLAVRWIWEAIVLKNKRSLIYSCLALLILTGFHPYFIPLFGLISVFALATKLKSDWKSTAIRTVLTNVSMLPAAVYYFWIMANDQGFNIHQTQVNQLPLDVWYFWLIMLLPFIPAVIWMAKRLNISWPLIWIVSAIICMILPFPWTRKYTQGLLPALVILTLPFWLMLADWIEAKKIILPLKICLAILIAFPYIHLLQTQVFMVNDEYWSKSFYRSNGLFEIWDRLKSEKRGMVLTTDLWSNYWTPAYSTEHVWIGHEHETPNFMQRKKSYSTWTVTTDKTDFNSYLNDLSAASVVAIGEDQQARVGSLIDQSLWKLEAQWVDASLWSKK